MTSYTQGKKAFLNGRGTEANPYPSGSVAAKKGKREQWFDGWYDARIGQRLGHILEKYGLEWP